MTIISVFLLPSDCVWDEWSEWTPCSVTCGNGSSHRTREILHVEQYGGKPCNLQESNQTMKCFPVECPVPCEGSVLKIRN